MKRQAAPFLSPAIALALILGLGTSARAGVVYSNFGPANGGLDYNTSGGSTVGNDFAGDNVAVGETFTASTSGTLSQITLALQYVVGPNAATVSLLSDAGGTPGAVLESWSVSNLPTNDGNFHTPLTVTDATSQALVAGTSYWVVVSTTIDSTLNWNWSNTGGGGNPVQANHATSFDGGATWTAATDSQSAFSVTETPLVVAAPEPTALVLLGTGLSSLAVNGLRRRRQR